MPEDCREPICRDPPFKKLDDKIKVLQKMKSQCPLNKEELGMYSWSLLHTFAAYYPEKPTETEKRTILGFLEGFKLMYPCTHCRSHFQKDYERDPPQLQSQEQLVMWVCRQHNYVNKILGKKEYECEFSRLKRRWRTGCMQDQF